MPAIQRSEFALALNQVASERGVDVSVVLDTVKNAILAAYRKDHPGTELEEYVAELNPNTGEAKILHEGNDVTPPGFGRIAAQTAKQVILQKIREKEKEAILTDYKIRMGTIVNGMVLRFAGPNIIVDIGKTEAVMPPPEQVANEKYHLNQRLSVHLVEIREGPRGEEIIVSRASNGLLEGLFRREVPEVAQGSVEIKAVVREPGNRSKVAVFSNQSGIDPVGSCVGQKGVRIQAVIQETGGIEKIDIIQYSEDLKTYVANALSPAKNVRVELNEEEKVAHVFVPQEELSLAIGKDGQNVRLASKLSGVRIEIEGNEIVAKPTEIEEATESTEETKETNAVEEPKTADPAAETPEQPAAEAGTEAPETVIDSASDSTKSDAAAENQTPEIAAPEANFAAGDSAAPVMGEATKEVPEPEAAAGVATPDAANLTSPTDSKQEQGAEAALSDASGKTESTDEEE
jgi:transcription termination/antitermination protein NusA